MFKYLFGSNEDSTTPLTNEPTIDYNNTIHTIASERNRLSPSRFNTESRSNSNYVLDYSDDELDSEEELTRDFQRISRNLTRSTESIRDWDLPTNHSLPTNYPGKFPKSTRTQEAQVSNGAHKGAGTYGDHVSRTYEPLSDRVPSADYSENFIEKSDTTEQIAKLEQEINEELRSSRKRTKTDGIQLDSVILKVKQQNQFLSNLNELIDINNSDQEIDNIPSSILRKYQALKEAYIKELNNSQVFYKGYYKLIGKYRQLKNAGNGVRSSAPDVNTSKSGFFIKEKVRLIKSSTKEENIKLICVNILRELDAMEDKDKTIAKYKQDLDAANERIRQLELQAQSK
ncbi:hypothetical protein G9P44_004761 [Scheffersomyces stipitis]|nr:hypothetical protein G9P44_004761 [Scheffersomyces stipitis]